INSKSKKEDYSWINKIENLNRLLRKVVPKRGRFRSLGTMQDYADLFRLYHDFLWTSRGSNEKTPAQEEGVLFPRLDNWADLIRFAHLYILYREPPTLSSSNTRASDDEPVQSKLETFSRTG
ncbi:hypothetical protein AKJ45_02040, partial [candidate division MSBL1 archaeon SCGC-AAA261F19]